MKEEHPEIRTARLKAMSPETVFEELRQIADSVKKPFLGFDSNEKGEEVLLARGEHLIDLGLARYGGTPSVVDALYKRAVAGTGDAVQDRGIRLACLSNRIIPQLLFGEGLHKNIVITIAATGDEDEVKILLTNPSARALLRNLYIRSDPFSNLTDDRWRDLVYASIGNEGLNADESNVDGPDLLAWDIQKNLFQLLGSAPLEGNWLRVLYWLVDSLDPYYARSWSKLEEIHAVIDRWDELVVRETWGDGEAQGVYTALPLRDEFRCVLAAMYGRALVGKSFAYLGTASDEDITRRCAHYGLQAMSPEEIRSYYSKDGDVFVLAALMNESVLLSRQSRVALEECLTGDLRFIYRHRCEQIKKRVDGFEVNPVSDYGEDLMDDIVPPPSKESEAVAVLLATTAQLNERVQQISKNTTWAFFILLGTLLYLR